MSYVTKLLVPIEAQGERLDKFLASLCMDLTRVRIQEAIVKGEILVNKGQVTQKYKLKGAEEIEIDLAEPLLLADQPQNLPLAVIYEDESILVIDKPAGLTVHPGAGQKDGTLVNALLYHRPALKELPRAGIVHRLDKDTTGLMVIAKTERARVDLINDLKEHKVERLYLALVHGELLNSLTITAPIGRHPVDRKKMAVVQQNKGKEAITHIQIVKRFPGLTLLQARLQTGRTHQIRVHLSSLSYPLVGDKTYGRKTCLSHKLSLDAKIAIESFSRQALAAIQLELNHPLTKEHMVFAIPIAEDFRSLLTKLESG